MKTASSLVFKLTSQGLIAVALSGIVLQLPGCGGGGTTEGAPLNPAPGPAAPLPLRVDPEAITLYVNQPTSVLVTGGVAPYRAFSSDPTLLPVLQDVIGSTITLSASNGSAASPTAAAVTLTVTDAVGGSTKAAATIIPTPFLDREKDFRVVGANCSSGNVCAGQTATVSVVLRSNTGAPLAGRQVRFEALQGQYNFVLDDAATQLSKAITVLTDAQGLAIVRIRVDVGAITSFGLIRATDLVTGSRLDSSFPIVQVTDGAEVLTVSPTSWKIVGPFVGICSSNVESGYYIFGGSPPYRVVSSVPDSVLVSNRFGAAASATTTVTSNGGYFVGVTTGGCIANSNPILFITDSTGRTVGVGLENAPGTVPLPTAPPPATFAVNPLSTEIGATVVVTTTTGTPPTTTTTNFCPGTAFARGFFVDGGIAPYRVSLSSSSGSIRGLAELVPGTGAYSNVGGSFVVDIAGTTGNRPIGTISSVTVVDGTGKSIIAQISCK